jgi:hypothetical protein
MIDYMSEYITDRFKSFERVDKSVWHRRGLHIVLENRLFQIAVTDNEWSAAWMLIERDDIDDVGGNRNIMRRHYRTYLNCIKNALIDGFGEAIGYGGAWICGAVYRKEPVEARAAYARKGGGATVSAISGQTAG